MAFALPVSLDVEGRRCLVAGGGTLAAARVADLARAGADVVVVTPAPSRPLTAVTDGGAGHLVPRAVVPGDVRGTFLVLVTGEDPVDVEALFRSARAEGSLLNVTDDPAHCDLAIPAVVRRGALAVAVSTGGRAPAVAKRLRRLLEELLDQEWAALVEACAAARERALPRDVAFDEWARRWGLALEDLDGLLAVAGESGAEAAADRVLAALRGEPVPAVPR